MKAIPRLLVVVAAIGHAAAARADVKVAGDVWNGPGRFSGVDYGISERFERAWLVLHFTYKAPCPGSDGECELDDPVRVRVPGLTYDPSTRQVRYQEEGAAPLVCATVVRHRFLRSWETVDATGSCGHHTVNVHSFIDDGYGGRDEQREEIHFGAAR